MNLYDRPIFLLLKNVQPAPKSNGPTVHVVKVEITIRPGYFHTISMDFFVPTVKKRIKFAFKNKNRQKGYAFCFNRIFSKQNFYNIVEKSILTNNNKFTKL